MFEPESIGWDHRKAMMILDESAELARRVRTPAQIRLLTFTSIPFRAELTGEVKTARSAITLGENNG